MTNPQSPKKPEPKKPAKVFVLLVRHYRQRESANEVAEALQQAIEQLPPADCPKIRQIWYAKDHRAQDTALIIRDKLLSCGTGNIQSEYYPNLDPTPDRGGSYKPGAGYERVSHRIIKFIQDPLKKRDAIMLVGHQPQLGWIAEDLTGTAHPINNAEILCIETDKERLSKHQGRLRWSIAPTDKAASRALLEKIRSKMQLATVLGGLILPSFALFFDPEKLGKLTTPMLTGRSLALYIATGLLLLALALYMATMYCYDRLLMPKRFWEQQKPRARPQATDRAGDTNDAADEVGNVLHNRPQATNQAGDTNCTCNTQQHKPVVRSQATPPLRSLVTRTGWDLQDRITGGQQPDWLVRRPPSSDTWILYQNMKRIWYWMFMPATYMVAAALLFLAFAVLDAYLIWFLIWAVAGVLIFLFLYLRGRPHLGTED